MSDKPVKVETPESVIRKRRTDLNIKEGYKDLLKRVVIVSFAVWFLLSFVFLVCQANGMSNFPSIKDGDLLIAYRLQKKYEKDDAVVFEMDGKKTAGRIVAFETDIVTISEQGFLYVNGTRQQGEILYPTYPRTQGDYKFTVPQGECFILCDYRTKCKDSRDFGAIKMSDLKGKIITILRRRGI
ncbi:MAG: signal peptidase I [Ruminococcus sp.]|nr:signal peptidase I [Candidatus Copronaster equi]